MCGGGGGGLFGFIPKLLGKSVGITAPTPTTPTVDPAAERRKAEADAAAKANKQLLTDARRKRAQKGLLATESTDGSSVLAAGKPAASNPSTVLGSGGA